MPIMTLGVLAYETKVPSDGVAGGKPNPKKDNPVSIPMFPTNPKINSTIMIQLIFGRIPVNIIFKPLVPIPHETKTA
ncbi:hypothetical protein [Tissierella sp.]|uniref:hypothetical protein n=1 Tax=Tissierella sp. TaxID=41274 RepID=UPI003044F2A1